MESTSAPILPKPKKPVKYTQASLRIMQTCDKAFQEHHFVLLYFTNRRTFNQLFMETNFKNIIKNNFNFLQLSRKDKSGNWLTSTYHFESSPYYAILDPTTGKFISIYYADMTLEELSSWLSKFNGKFEKTTSDFSPLIDDLQEQKRKSAYAYRTKLKVTFSCANMDDKVLYVAKTAPLEYAFEKYCEEQNIDINQYYFLFRGVQLPPNMTASQFGLKNGSTINVHNIEDKTSKEQISLTVVGIDNNSSVYQVEKGKKINQFLRNYCETNKLQPESVRFTYKNDIVLDDLTFAEHNMKDGDKIIVHAKTFAPPSDYLMRPHMIMKSNEIPHMLPNEGFEQFQMAQMQQMALPQAPMMYMYNQPQRTAQIAAPAIQPIAAMPAHQMQQIQQIPPQIGQIPTQISPQISQQMPSSIPPPITQQVASQINHQMPSFNQVQYQVHPSKVYPFSKPVDQNSNQSIWENFDMQMQ